MTTRLTLLLSASLICLGLSPARAAIDHPDTAHPDPAHAAHPAQPIERTSSGTITIDGKPVAYQAVAGTLVVHPHGWDDSDETVQHQTPGSDAHAIDGNPDATASMFYVAYFRKDSRPDSRPVTFIYNGGPGSSSVWLHMGAFGPRRVVTNDDTHTPASPYRLIDNPQSLLDVTDLVFIDAPGTGFGRINGKDKEKLFWGVDADGQAFTSFVSQFLAKYGRYNSPKYLFGESYGTMRSAVLVNDLQNQENIDFNGVILLSQILSYDNSVDEPALNPGMDEPFVLALPTYAATAWYHHKLPQQPEDLKAFLAEVEHFASTDYLAALQQGAALPDADRARIVERLHAYTGLPADYIRRADLRIDGGEFSKTLQSDDGMTTGRLDTRFSGPALDPLSEEAGYDPQSTAISSAYVSLFNDYVRKTLNYGDGLTYRPEIDIQHWNFHHAAGGGTESDGPANVMPDLAEAMKTNPTLKIMLNAGYFDLATPYYEGVYEMRHLPIPTALQKNIEFRQYQSGHMVYANIPALTQLHDNIADFIRRTDNQPAPGSSAP
ncbi:peptidase S10 [Gluconacetobacter liquefaciens]|uniref:Carboxypeptidase C (Cathepsin A) n=1 Tax=Gluconacetobacter liquefaciens TaxID=89584 RepID=A0A370G2Z0_GLULI|nr:peptidase S10 [Gluconacetobacter liquefaciens]MBB2186563.1 peptidase S10 [Gluconacetobacter liquefaciens]RDI38231.1 carboxypeptidase C (cathepsin A) [Gluconacetobacter liquefaciens]GBR05409.1 carboxypeptidase-like protein [Gluconacetobacter liquefaciens NRIC 0522]GEB36714.1 peptidase S10 [Gluconacetobacter liquefaciens]